MAIWEFLLAAGVPTAITGFIVWYFKRSIELRDAEKAKEEERLRKERVAEDLRRANHEKNVENLIMYLIRTSRATNVLAEATAKAVQRIPDAHCNGDMTEALKKAAEIHRDEKDYLFSEAVRGIIEN